MHPLHTLIESQRHQVRGTSAAHSPRRRSSTEEAAIAAHSASERKGFALAIASGVITCMFVLLLATALI